MGGCRCTYRNCTVKSDGKTHMFHYPVFEKIRCHQWLINAHRLEFLDLKVSQLKNRVVCQHHFKDENFMNFKKDKLTFDAIPTEDGPYCDITKYVDLNRDSSKLYTIIIDDIENDYNDKKANYSLKYGDFLTNLDLMDIEKIDEDNISYKNTYNNNVDIVSPNMGRGKGRLFNEDNSILLNISLPDKSDKKIMTHPTLAVSPYMGGTDITINDIQKNQKPSFHSKHMSSDSSNKILIGNATANVNYQINQQKEEPNIKIISEKKVTGPVPITGKFEPVSPNFVINVSKMKRKLTTENIQNTTSIITENKKISNQDTHNIIEIEIAPVIKEEDAKPQEDISTVNLTQNCSVSQRSPRVSVIKPRVPPERIEAINRKREFNMKLRDMVESCLDNLDNGNNPNEESKPLKNIKSKSNTKKVQHIKSLPKNTPILSPQEYTIAFLEARMRKMENTLLEKIDQNSMKINDLKNTFAHTSSEKQLVRQSIADEETHKKKLYQEISKYLSPSSKSLIYEELFINRFALNDSTTSPKRKRRRRI